MRSPKSASVRIRASMAKLVTTTPRTISTAKVITAMTIAGIASGDPAGSPASAAPPIMPVSRTAHTGITATAKPHAPIAMTDSSSNSACSCSPAWGSRCSSIAAQPAPKPANSAVMVQNSPALAVDAGPRRRMLAKRSVHSSASPAMTIPQPIMKPSTAREPSVSTSAARLMTISSVLNGT